MLESEGSSNRKPLDAGGLKTPTVPLKRDFSSLNEPIFSKTP
jgi:hypothetical protein